MTRMVMLAVVAALSVPTGTAGQVRPDERFFVNVNVVHHNTVSWWAEGVFDQTAYEIHHRLQGGAGPDVSAGIRLVSKLSAGVALSRWATTNDLSVAIHDQNRFSTHFLNTGQQRFDHGQVAYHFPVVWTVQVTDRLDIAILGGPSLYHVTHSPVTGVEAASIDAFGYPDVLVSTVSTQRTRQTGSGYHYGFDFTVRWNEWMGFGLLMRSISGSLPVPAGRPTTAWCSSELGLGFRFRF